MPPFSRNVRWSFSTKRNRRTLRLAFHLFDRERRALLGGGPVLAAQCCGNLGDAILKLTVGIAERLRRW